MEEKKSFYNNGNLMEFGFMDKNGKQGKWFFYNEDGTIFKEVEYKNNAEHGMFIRYFENGKVAFKSQFKDGKRDGKGIEYYENGNVNEEWVYENGEFSPINFWDEFGSQTLENGTGFKIAKFGTSGGDVYKQYFENGHFIKEEKIISSIYLGFTPKDNSEN